MALIENMMGILFTLIKTIGMFGFLALALVAWIPVYYYAVKYKISVVIRERVGNGVVVFYTKGAIMKNKARNRQELRIIKNKMNPFKFWTLPLYSGEFYHTTKKGKRFLEFYKVGELDTDLKPIPPLNPVTLQLKPTDVKIFDWVTQGLEKDARETRSTPDKLSRLAAIGVPVILVTALIFGFIYGLSTVKDLQAGNARIAASLTSWGDKVVAVEEARAGIQNIEPASGDNKAVEILENVGIDLE